MRRKVHRGRTKQDKVPITVRLTPDEVELLTRVAETHCRSRSMQALWFIKKGILDRPSLGGEKKSPEPEVGWEPSDGGECPNCGTTLDAHGDGVDEDVEITCGRCGHGMGR